MKIVINVRHGGFGLSEAAMVRYAELKERKLIIKPIDEWLFPNYYFDEEKDENLFCYYDLERNDPILVQVIEELGDKANGNYSELRVVKIPDDVKWHISEYDGMEHVAENHRTWY